jgi:hypothetical protein
MKSIFGDRRSGIGHTPIRCLALIWAITAQILAALGSPPLSPASLNIKPIYEGLWLPTGYVPGKYRCASESVSANPANPPRKISYPQSFLYEAPFPSHGGKFDPDSNVDDWRRVNISSMTLYATAQDARGAMLYHAYPSFSRIASFGDESLFREWEEIPWKMPSSSYASKLYDKDHDWNVRSTEGFVRIGRVVFRISIRGVLMIDRVDADTGKGFKSFQGFITVAEVPSRTELEEDLHRFVAQVRSYAGAQGWLTDPQTATSSTGERPSSMTPMVGVMPDVRTGTPKSNQLSSRPPFGDAPDDSAGGIVSVISGNGATTKTPDAMVSSAVTALGTLVVSGLTALGAGLMMFGMGVSPQDVIDGVKELFSGTPPEPPAYVEPSPSPPPIHHDGDVNESGEVWSDEDRGWVGRNLYDQERNRRRDITDQLERERHSGQSEDVKKAYDDWQQSKEKLEAVREEGRMLVKKENLRQWVENRERDLQEQSYWSDVKNNFLLNVDGELTALPHETFEICRETAKAVKSGVDTVSDVVKDATNWEILRATGAQTSRDILGSPLQSAGKVGKFYHDVTAGAGKVAVNIVANPVEIAKVVTGYENWSQALDYHVPLSKRIGHALMGTVDTVTMFGGAVAKEGGAALARGIEAVDTVAEAAKAEKLAMEAGAIARKLSPEDLARHQAWELGEQQARQKVSTLHASKNPGELRDAVLQIQGDKRGLQMLNGEASEVKATFNREIRGIYKETDAAVETRLRESLDRKGVDLDRYDLKPTHATNPSADPFKIGADRDITYSLYDKQSGQWVRDVPADQVQGVYNEEFFKAAHGRPPTGADDVAGFASKMDQQCVDSVHPEAYGRGPADLETALHQPGRAFQDPTAVGKSVSYKAHEWYGKASDAMKNGDPVLAEQHLSEGFRQTTKQFDNLLVARHDALREAGTRGLKEIPERMQEAVDVLKTTHSGVSPVVVERQLAELGYHSPNELATDLGEYVEAMDKLRPGSAATINWRAAYTGARTVMAGYQQGGSLP